MPASIPSGSSDDAAQDTDIPCSPFGQDELAFYQALLADDQRAWNCLYIRVTASFVPYARQRSSISLDDAHDILQEGLAEFSIKLRNGRYVYQGRPVAAYVFIVCRNRWVSFLKKNNLARLERYRESVADDDAGEAGYQPSTVFSLTAADDELVTGASEVADAIWAESDVDWEAVGQAFAEMGDDCKTMLQAFYVDDKSLKECGELIGLRESSAKVKRFRCAQRLKTLYLKYRKED
ncbi:MAG: sigma-70 family RNA polymerase sigma factor [Bacteroidetes bacterium]|nr:sigma-70 family RNA polymerase sigma factor [Fibrella sp.]